MKKNYISLIMLTLISFSIQAQWIYWGSENYGNFQGASFGSPIDFAQRFEPADLSDYDGKSITKMRFHPGVIENSVEYTLKIWEAAPGGSPVEVFAQAVSSVTFGQLNIIDLTTPWLIDVSKELWIGVTVGNGGFMGHDNVPAIEGKGNKIGMAGDWYNWGDNNYLIHAYAEATDDNGDDNGDEIIVLADFEDGTFQGFDETGWGTTPDTEIIDNPAPGGINTSSKVLSWSDENPWGGAWRWDPGVFSPDYDKMLVDVMVPADAEWGGTNQWFRLDGNNSASGVENWQAAVAEVTERDEWVTIEFDLSSMIIHDYQILFLLSSFDQYYADNFRWVIGEEVVLDPVTLTLLADPEEGGTPIGAGVYDPGESIFIQLIVNPGYQFFKWEKDGEHFSWIMNFSYTMPAEDVTLTAILNQVFALNLEVSPEGAGLVTGAGNYQEGAQVSLTATANPGYSFVNWTDEMDNEVSADPAFTYTMPAMATTLTANFQEADPVVIDEFPWTENFEQAIFPPEGWSVVNVLGAETWVRTNAPGGGFAAYHVYGYFQEDTWMITPPIVIPQNGEFELSFRHYNVYADYYPGVGGNNVMISTGSANPADNDFVQVWSPATVPESTWEDVEISLDAYAGQTIYIAFRYFAEYTHEWYVDDVQVEELASEPAGTSCENPYIVSLPLVNFESTTSDKGNNYSSNSILPPSFYINGNDMVLQFTVEQTGLLTGSMTASQSWIGVFIMQDCPNPDNPAIMNAWSTSSTNSLTLPSSNPNQPQEILLTPGDYFLIVSSYPPPQTIDFSLNLELIPYGDCMAPVILTATNQTQNSVDLGWTPTGSEGAWNIIYGLPGFDVETEGTLVENVTANPYTLGDLDPGTSYEFYVQAVCDGGLTSDWAGPKSFTTECDFIFTESFIEGFESETAPPECWAVWYANPTPPEENLIIHSTEHAFSGSRSLRFSSEVSASPINQFLRTPELGFDSDILISFHYRTGLQASVFAVGTSENGTEWTWGSDINANNITWQEFTMQAPASVKYIAIEFKGPYFRTLFIDDFAVTSLFTVEYEVVEVDGHTNGSLTATANGEPIASGDLVPQESDLMFMADADPGFIVKQWTLNGTVVNEGNDPYTGNTLAVNEIDSHVNVTVEYEEVPVYTLTLLADPIEGGTVSGEGDYQEGDQVAISAEATEGYEFVNWTDAADNVISTNESFTYTMPAEDVTLTANFGLLYFELILIPDPLSGGELTGAGMYTAGEQITVTADASDGYEFTGWYDVFDNHVSDDAQFVFTMPASDIALVAYFDVITVDTYILSLEASPANAGEVTGDGEYEAGEQVNITATPFEGYFFINWTDADDIVISTEASFSYTMPAADVTLTANFDLENSVSGIGTTQINLYPNPARNNFNIVADEIIIKVTIVDITGKVVFTEAVNNKELNVNGSFEKGTYLVRVYTEGGISIRKLQIQ